MSFPVRCFTCGKVIGDLYQEYEKRTKTFSEEEGEVNTINLSSKEVKKTKKGEVLDELGLKRYCCRIPFLTHVDVHY